nr:hypothetical protein [Kibdelosporangium sp. MJ126-NF4]CEL17795.1 hypothetical protein [Kibdelosporangium sp. MJ126-NF4]CTQ90981.1 hypothetical protein [Kibdelosporangium sp. MJ126-NF4]
MHRTLLRRLSVLAGAVSITAGLSLVPSAQIGFTAVADTLDDLSARTVPSPFSRFIPTGHTTGDKDFKGHGPDVHAVARIVKTGDRSVSLFWSMNATEDRPDRTNSFGDGTFQIYFSQSPFAVCVKDVQMNDGTGVVSVLNKDFPFSYTDTDHSDDEFFPPPASVVSTWNFVGDTAGDDVGKTGVRISTRPLKVVLTPCP